MKGITRRKFLKISAYCGAAALASSSLVKVVESFDDKWKDFKPNYEYGNWIPYFSTEGFEERKKQIMNTLISDAKTILPPGTIYELRMKVPTDFGTRGVAWYYGPTIPKRLVDYSKNPKIEKTYGHYYLVGRYRA